MLDPDDLREDRALTGRTQMAAPPPPPRYGPNYQPSYSAQLGQMILDDKLGTEYKPPWYEQTLSYRLPSLTDPSAKARFQQMSGLLAPTSTPRPVLDFPTRLGVGMPWSAAPEQNVVNDMMAQYLGPGTGAAVALGMQPGEGRGGVVPGTAIATTPITLSNFSTWGRERLFAAIDSVFSPEGGSYPQGPGATFGTDTPKRSGNILDDFFGVLKDVGTSVANVFDGVLEFWRTENAKNRALQVSNLFQTGSAVKNANEMLGIDTLTSFLTNSSGKFDSAAVQALATQRGVSYTDMISELFDLDPAVVRQIAANPVMSEGELRNLEGVWNAPLSRNPAVNMGLEFGLQMGLLLVPYSRATKLLKGAQVASEGAGFARGLMVGERAFAGTATAGQRALQVAGWGTKRALQVNSINTTVGWTIGGMEWGIKQLAVLGGNDQIVEAMDKAMWNMPLSMNPGLNIITAFSSHPLQALGLRAERGALLRPATDTGLLRGRVMVGTPGTPGEVGMVNLRTLLAGGGRTALEKPIIAMKGAKSDGAVVAVGDRLVRLDPDGTELHHLIESQELDAFTPLFDDLGPEFRQTIEAAHAPGNPDGLTLDDLKETLLYVSMSAVRSELERSGLANVQGLGGAHLVERAQTFMENNIGRAHALLQDQLAGRTTALADEFRGQFWELEKLNDTRQAAIKAALSAEFDPGLAATKLLSWEKVSKQARLAYLNKLIDRADVTPVYRATVNRGFVQDWVASIDKRYGPADYIPNTELDRLKTLGGAVERFGDGGLLVRKGKKFKPLTREKVDKIIASILEDEARAADAEAAPPREGVPAFAKDEVVDDASIQRVLRISPRSLETIRAAEALPPEQLGSLAIPRDVAKVVAAAEGITPDALLVDPAAAWAKVLDWFNGQIAAADQTRVTRDTINRFADVAASLRRYDPATLDAAVDGAAYARDYLLNPIEYSYLAKNQTLGRTIRQAQAAVQTIEGDMAKLAKSPFVRARVENFGTDMGRYVLPLGAVTQEVTQLLEVIGRVTGEGRGLSDADLALLAQPEVHPYLKADILRKAELTPEELAIIERINPDSLTAVVHDLLGPEAEVNAESLAKIVSGYDSWVGKVIETGGMLAAAGQRLRVIDGTGHSPELVDLWHRADEWSARTGQPWTSARISTVPRATTAEALEAVKADNTRLAVQRQIKDADIEIAAAEKDIATLSAPRLDVTWPETPFKVLRSGGQKAANALAKELNEATGKPTKAVKMKGGRYGILVGEAVPLVDEVAPAVEAAPAIPESMLPPVRAEGAPMPDLTSPEATARTFRDTLPPEQTAKLDALEERLAQDPNVVAEEPYAEPAAAAPAAAVSDRPAVYGTDTDFPIPGEETTRVPARFRLAELSDLVADGDEGYRKELQPRRERGKDARSLQQGTTMQRQFDPNLALRIESGSHGPQVVSPEGQVIAGNLRTRTMRGLTDAQYAKYTEALAARAHEYGLSRQQVEQMDRPVLVREVPEELSTPELARQLNLETGRMTTPEMARAMASDITPDDLAKLDLGEKTTLTVALGAAKNQPFVRRMLDILGSQKAAEYVDTAGALNPDGVRLFNMAILQKVVRDPTGALIEEMFASDDWLRLRNGLEDAAGQLSQVEAAVERGELSESLADALRGAIDEYRSLREQGLDVRSGRPQTLGFADPLAADLGWALYSMPSRAEVASFFREYAKAALEQRIDVQTEGMFGAATPVPNIVRRSIQKAIDALNAARRDKAGFFEKGANEIAQVADADGTIPAHFQNSAGMESFAQDVPVIESPEAAIGARISGRNVVVRGNPLDPATYAGAEKAAGEIVFHGGPENYAKAVQSLFDDPAGAATEYARRAATVRNSYDLENLFSGSALRVNNGTATGADYLILSALSHDGLRFNEAGQFNGRFNTGAVLGDAPDLAHLTERRIRATHEAPDVTADDAAIFGSEAVDTRIFDAKSGVVPDLTPEKAAVKGAIDSGAHTFVKRGGALDDAAREATGASRGNPAGVVLEVNPPNQAKLLRLAQERLDAARQMKAEAEANMAEAPAPPVRPAEQVPIPDDVYQLLIDYTSESRVIDPSVFGAVGELHQTIGQISDTIKSLDEGLMPLGRPMSEAEMVRLREGLIEWLAKRLDVEDRAPKRARKRAQDAADRQRVEKGIYETPEEWGDDMVKAWRGLERIVKPADGPLTGYEGTQYDLGFLPARGAEGELLSPRILATTPMLDLLKKVAPDLPAELAVGRKQTVPHRVASARAKALLDSDPDVPADKSAMLKAVTRLIRKQFDGNPEHGIREATVDRFARSMVGELPDNLTPEALKAWEDTYHQALGIMGALHKEMSKPHRMIGPFRIFRKEYTLTAHRFDEIVKRYLTDKVEPKFEDLPEWAQRFVDSSGKTQTPFFDAWTKADNRIRTWFSEQPNGASRYVEAMYGSQLARRGSRTMAQVTMIYHVGRFLLDTRWLALERLEAPTITLFQEGPMALIEAMGIGRGGKLGITKTGKTSKPFFIGLDDLSKMRADFAWWLAPDMGQMLAWRQNYLLTLVERAQARDLPEIMRQMAVKDPELRQTLKAFGDTPQQWLEKLNDSWELHSSLSRKLTLKEAEDIFGPRLARGEISEADYTRLLASAAEEGGFHYVQIPALEAEIRASIGNPVLEPLMILLRHRTEVAWNDAAQLIYGQTNRSNVQRLLNHPFLWWPISYQIKATKWLAGLMFDRFMGVDTGSIGALTLDRLHAQHQQAFAEDAEYRQFFKDNATLLFVASMFFPITPWDIGVSLSPFTRLAIGTAAGALGLPEGEGKPYQRNIMAIGPGYTYFNLLPRLGYELRKGNSGLGQAAGGVIGTAFPYSVPVGNSSSQQEQAAQDVYQQLPLPQVPGYTPPSNRYGP